MFATSQHAHFIGIGGIGMSGIAEILLNQNMRVSGSDLRRSSITDRLAQLGAVIYEGHDAAHIAGATVVVTSSAVNPDNPEVLEARARKIPVIQRAEMLAELMRLKYGIAIAGMHGKTTTTSMVASVLAAGGLDPTVVVGGRVDALGSNARLGTTQYMVAEADESDRSFLKLSPILAVVTNLDREHMDCYRDMEDVENCFLAFMDRVPFYGAVTACIDNPLLAAILPRAHRRVFTYGTAREADYRLVTEEPRPGTRTEPPSEVSQDSGTTVPHPSAGSSALGWDGQTSAPEVPGRAVPHPGAGSSAPGWDGSMPAPSRFKVITASATLGPFELHVPGHHNVLNATAAVAIAHQLEVPPDRIAAGIRNFRGVDRRFQLRGTSRGVSVVDDYGHHPTEIKATLAAARECGFKHIHVIFQPHRYSRTADLMDRFATAFTDADSVFVLPIYAASEQPIPGVTAERLVERIEGPNVRFVADFPAAIDAAASAAADGDLILTLGAGNVSQLAPQIVEKLGE